MSGIFVNKLCCFCQLLIFRIYQFNLMTCLSLSCKILIIFVKLLFLILRKKVVMWSILMSFETTFCKNIIKVSILLGIQICLLLCSLLFTHTPKTGFVIWIAIKDSSVIKSICPFQNSDRSLTICFGEIFY